MNNEGYFVTCSKCKSYKIKYDYEMAVFNVKTGKSETPVKCLNCGFETKEVK